MTTSADSDQAPGRNPEPRSQQLFDRWAIIEALNAYAFHFDRNEPEEVGQLFTTDAVVDYGPEMGLLQGRDAIVTAIASGLNTLFAATSHHVSNTSVSFEADGSARLTAYVYAWHRYRDGSPDGYPWGQYHTTLCRTSEGWKFTSLTLKVAGAGGFHRKNMHGIGPALIHI